MSKVILISLFFLLSLSFLSAQEVLCNVRVIPKNDIPISDRQKLQTLQNQYVNLLIIKSGLMRFLKMKNVLNLIYLLI